MGKPFQKASAIRNKEPAMIKRKRMIDFLLTIKMVLKKQQLDFFHAKFKISVDLFFYTHEMTVAFEIKQACFEAFVRHGVKVGKFILMASHVLKNR